MMSRKMMGGVVAVLCVSIVATMVLTSCASSEDTKPKVKETSKSTETPSVKENGDGRFDPGETLTMPNSVQDVVDFACVINEGGELTQVSAQMFQGFGIFIGQFKDQPDEINPTLGIKTPDEAEKLSTAYKSAGQELYELTADENVDIGDEWGGRLGAVCDGDPYAIAPAA